MSKELLSKLPSSAKNFWVETYNSAKALLNNDGRAEKIAWKAVINRLHKTEESFVAKSSDFQPFNVVKYTFKAEEVISTKSIDGKTLVNYLLTDSTVDKQGKQWGALALKSFTESINLEGLVGRIDPNHDLIKRLKAKGMTPDEIEEYLKGLETGIKAISATYDPKGRVTATIAIDNEIYEEASKYDSVSIEARYPASFTDTLIPQANIMSFVLTNNPANPNANRI